MVNCQCMDCLKYFIAKRKRKCPYCKSTDNDSELINYSKRDK